MKNFVGIQNNLVRKCKVNQKKIKLKNTKIDTQTKYRKRCLKV